MCAQGCIFVWQSEVNIEYVSQLSSTSIFETISFTELALSNSARLACLSSLRNYGHMLGVHLYRGTKLESTGPYDLGQAFLPIENLSSP